MTQAYENVFECYKAISRRLTESVPEAWKQITVEFEIIVIDDASEDCIYYTPRRWWRKERQFFIEDTNFTDIFFQLARLASTPEKGLFKKCLFVLQNNGTYKVDFIY